MKFTREDYQLAAACWPKRDRFPVSDELIQAALWAAASVNANVLKQTAVACGYCGKEFMTGRGTGRRMSAMYCCNAHRVAAQRATEQENR